MTTITASSPSSTLQDATASPFSPTEQDPYNTQIDALLTRYLLLLDEYTTLRSSLSSLQAGMYQNLARANFTAERGVRYGKEYFDERMVASRRVLVRVIQRADTTATTTTTPPPPVASADQDSGTLSSPNDDTDTPEADKEDDTKKKIRKNDPLRWFGLLTPLPLRLAQTQAIQAVEQIIPRLVTVNAEMAQVEIEVRRARKRREKAAVKAKAAAVAAAAKDAK
ncbi:hypothetical protein NEUTE2DRAFT_63680 [Neurospora tetrasperma FGSC 2509]|nr:hypothetical protein NEUTE2DRAFT_63680 [Neurospora tetrasperma FGSC 2509]